MKYEEVRDNMKWKKYVEDLEYLAERMDETDATWESTWGHMLLNLVFSALVDLLEHHAQEEGGEASSG